MASAARILFGGKAERSLNGTTWAAILEVTSFQFPQVEQGYADVTSLDSTGGFREYLREFKDVPDITITCNWLPATYETALSDSALLTPVKYRFTLPKAGAQTTNGGIATFDAFPTPKIITGAVNEVVGLEIVLKVTGGFTWTAGV